MNTEIVKVEISAETEKNAIEILDALLAEKIVTGGQMIQAPAKFLWKGAIETMDYVTVTSFTVPGHKQAIINTVKGVSIEEFPMITFTSIETNSDLATWVKDTVH